MVDTNYGPLGPSFTILEQWSDVVNQVIELDRNTCRELGAFLKQSGFANIQEQTIEIPVGEWSDTQGTCFSL